MDGLSLLFDTADFPARWQCGRWTTGHGWLHILADLGVWSAYVAIPAVLGYFLLRRRDLPFRMIFLLFGAFILACGTTHLMEAIIFWWPAYRLAGAIKVFTALVSWGTVFALVPVTPKALALRTPTELQQEINERKRVEESLRLSEERFRLLIEGTTDYAIFMLNPQGVVVSWNHGAERIHGYQADEIIGQHFARFFTTDDVAQSKPPRALETAARTGRLEEESMRVRKDGSRFWANTILTALRDSTGNLRGFLKITRDITERKQAEAALDENRRFVERIAQMIPSILYVYDLKEQRYIFVNPQIESILGYSAEETKRPGTTILMANTHPDDLPAVERANDQYQAAEDGDIVESEYRMRHVNGEWRWLHFRNSIFVRDDEGNPRQILGTAQDITERKRLEQEVLEIAISEQRRIGQELHDGIGQELTGLCMLADNLADTLQELSPADADHARRIAIGLHKSLGQIRALSRGLILVEVDAEGLMAALSDLTNHISEVHGVRCIFDCLEPVPIEDNFVATQLFRIAQEAITNALKHAKPTNIHVYLQSRGRYITMKIQDDGIGMPEIANGKKGIGLRIMRHRAEQIGAQFSVRAGAGHGTAVTCTLYRGDVH